MTYLREIKSVSPRPFLIFYFYMIKFTVHRLDL